MTEDRKLIIDVPPDVTPGEHQVVVVIADEPGQDVAAIAQHGGALDWLEDEPDLYTDADGEPVGPATSSVGDILNDLGIVALPWRTWPDNATFSRDEMYGDDGR